MNLDDYYNRILPVVGDSLVGKKVVFINPNFTHPIAEALARCGVKNQYYFHSEKVEEGDMLALSFGMNAPHIESSTVLYRKITQHNLIEKNWKIKPRQEITYQEIKNFLKDERVDLIVAGGSVEYIELASKVAMKTNIPLISFALFKDLPIRSAVFIDGPGLQKSMPDNIFRLMKNKSNAFIEKPKLENRLDWHDALDLAMNFAKAILLRGTKYQREDIEKLLYFQKRNVILRGSYEWPWTVNYVDPTKHEKFLERVFVATTYIPRPAIESIQDERAMVIGCGTGSLLIGELVHYYHNILLVDHKEFSPYNPVRQLVGTEYVNKGMKTFLLQGYLRRYYWENHDFWIKFEEGTPDFVDVMNTPKGMVAASNLCVKEDDDESIKSFNKLLDWYKPTIVVVATGRTYDDNFTICEILRKRGIKYIVPSAFPGATHFKTVVVDGEKGPCYECFQNNLTLDASRSSSVNEEMRSMLYMDPDDPTQPATIIETWPSTHMTLRLCIELSLNEYLRSSWFAKSMDEEKICFVGGNMVQKNDDGDGYIYGVAYPGQVVTYGVDDIAGEGDSFECGVCGRSYEIKHKVSN